MTCPMPDPRETLARIRKRADSATEGPWEVNGPDRPWATISHGPDSILHAYEQHHPYCEGCECGDPRSEVALSEADAEFIAASRANVPRLADALEKVLERHAPMPIYVLAEDCEAPDDHQHWSTSDGGDDICWDEPTGEIHCCECRDKWGNPMKHPCPTFTTITTALNGDEA